MKRLEEFYDERFEAEEQELYDFWGVKSNSDGKKFVNSPMPTLEDIREGLEYDIESYPYEELEEDYEDVNELSKERMKELDDYFDKRFKETEKVYQRIVEARAKIVAR